METGYLATWTGGADPNPPGPSSDLWVLTREAATEPLLAAAVRCSGSVQLDQSVLDGLSGAFPLDPPAAKDECT